MRSRPILVAWALVVVASMAVLAWTEPEGKRQWCEIAVVASGILVLACERP